MSKVEKKHGLVLRKTTLRVLNDNELLWVAGAGTVPGKDTLWDYQEEGLSNVYTTKTTNGTKPNGGNTIPTRTGIPMPSTDLDTVTTRRPDQYEA
jgi:hypothetical protein